MPTLQSAAPVLASLDIERTVAFYCSRLGFRQLYVNPGVWGIVSRDAIQPLHYKRSLGVRVNLEFLILMATSLPLPSAETTDSAFADYQSKIRRWL
ncbi:MAG: hypothetical protein ABI569_01555 [Casimicrobiaceae bacterium]